MAKKTVKHSKRATAKGGTSKIDSLFKNGSPAGGFRNLPTGTYEGRVKAGSAFIEPKAPGSDDYKASMQLIVISGEHEGEEQRYQQDLSTQVGVNIFMGDLKAMDLGEPTNLSEACEMFAETDNIEVSFWVGEASDEFPPNVRINERLDSGGADGGSGSEYTEDEINALSDDDLEQLARDNDVDPDAYDWDELREHMVKLLV